MSNLDIVVLGLGRFGSLWANCMARLGRVYAYDPFVLQSGHSGRNRLRPRSVCDLGWSSKLEILQNFQALSQAIQTCDVLFFCVPISALQDSLLELRPALLKRQQQFSCRSESSTDSSPAKPLWLMDTCSVKVQPMAWLRQTIESLNSQSSPSAFRLLGLHPMFGPDSVSQALAHSHGPNQAEDKLLEGLRLVLCPDNFHTLKISAAPSTTAEVEVPDLPLWQQHFRNLGLKLIIMSADEHDSQAASTQGLTHLLGRVLEALDIRPSPIATAGYQALCQLREQTCHDTWQLFLDLQRQNSYTSAMRCNLQKALEAVYATLANPELPCGSTTAAEEPEGQEHG